MKVSGTSTRDAVRLGALTESEARSLFRQGEEAVVFALLALSKQLAEAQGKTDPTVGFRLCRCPLPPYTLVHQGFERLEFRFNPLNRHCILHDAVRANPRKSVKLN